MEREPGTAASAGQAGLRIGDDGKPRSRSRPRRVFEVDEDAALGELELAWADGGCHDFSVDGATWAAISSAGDVLTGAIPDELEQKIRAHWQAMQ